MSSATLAAFLINALVQVPLIALVAFAAVRAVRRAPARQQYRVWLAALVACVVLPVASVVPRPKWSGGLQPAGGRKAAAPQPTTNNQRRTLDQLLERTQKPAAPGVNIAALLGAAYALFVLYRAAALAAGWRRMRRIIRSASEHSLHAGVPLLVSDDVSTPMTLGALRPVIIVPRALLGELSDRALAAVLGHELAHIKRRDFLVNALLEIATIPIAFHPVTSMLKRRLAESRELACDEQVTPRLVAPRDYARVLVDVAAFACAAPRPAYSLAMAGGDFEDRIRRIVKRPSTKYARALVAVAWGALAVSGVAAAGIAVRPKAAVSVGAAQGNAEERAKAACKAGRARDERAIPWLIAMLGDETPIDSMRCYSFIGIEWTPALNTFERPSPGEQAALALASIAEPSVEPLVGALNDRAPAVRRNAAWAIGEVRGGAIIDRDDAIVPLIRLLADADATVRRAAAFGLSELKSHDAVEALIVTLNDHDPAVRGMAAFALGEIRDARAAPRLEQLAKGDPDAQVRRAAKHALNEVRGD
jgi:beta-lactamase regulating signal transducer with metallopeptidase domain